MIKKYKVILNSSHQSCVFAKTQLNNIWIFHSKLCCMPNQVCFNYEYLIPLAAIPYTNIGELLYG